MIVQPDLCQTWSETTLLVFPRGGSIIIFFKLFTYLYIVLPIPLQFFETGTLGCCDAMDYDVTKAICCEDQDTRQVKFHNIAPVASLECCSTELYNTSDYSQYCNEQVIPNQVKHINIRIYNGQEYDASKQVPCIGANDEGMK